jgi:hypothetical protein
MRLDAVLLAATAKTSAKWLVAIEFVEGVEALHPLGVNNGDGSRARESVVRAGLQEVEQPQG